VALQEEVAAMAVKVAGYPGKCIPLSDGLTLLVQKWIKVEVEFDDLLCKLFDDNDSDGNGCLELKELRQMVRGLGEPFFCPHVG
jgi:hypothetical protein